MIEATITQYSAEYICTLCMVVAKSYYDIDMHKWIDRYLSATHVYMWPMQTELICENSGRQSFFFSLHQQTTIVLKPMWLCNVCTLNRFKQVSATGPHSISKCCSKRKRYDKSSQPIIMSDNVVCSLKIAFDRQPILSTRQFFRIIVTAAD